MIHKIMLFLSSIFRRGRAKHIKKIIDGLHKEKSCGPNRPLTIIDVGGAAHYWDNVDLNYLKTRNVKITLVNLGEVPENIVSDIFTYVSASGCDLSLYDDNSFDFAHSNSVIEHVGDWAEIRKFAIEMRRIAPTYYMQTPYFWFPIDPHFYLMPFFHWYPKQIRTWFLQHLPTKPNGFVKDYNQANIAVDSVNLLDGKQVRYLYNDGKLSYERILLIFPKSIITTNYHAK